VGIVGMLVTPESLVCVVFMYLKSTHVKQTLKMDSSGIFSASDAWTRQGMILGNADLPLQMVVRKRITGFVEASKEAVLFILICH
jgi:hypothetical protein